MLAYVGLSCGQCGPILWLCWPMLASCWFMWSQKIRKMGTAKKRCKTQDMLMVGSWGYVGPSWSYVGLSWGQCGPILGLCWPLLGLCWPLLGLCCPSRGYVLEADVGPAWGQVGPCWPILNHKMGKAKKCDEQNTVKRGSFWPGWSAAGAAAPLSYGEERNAVAMPRPGSPWPDLSAYARQPARGPTM